MLDIIPPDLQAIETALGECGGTPADGPAGEICYDLPRERLTDAVRVMRDAGAHHLSTITGQRLGDAVSVMYNFYQGRGITLRLSLPLDDLRVPTISGLALVANWYERELHEMLGVEIEGRGEIKPLLLPDDWDGPPPLLSEEDPA